MNKKTGRIRQIKGYVLLGVIMGGILLSSNTPVNASAKAEEIKESKSSSEAAELNDKYTNEMAAVKTKSEVLKDYREKMAKKITSSYNKLIKNKAYSEERKEELTTIYNNYLKLINKSKSKTKINTYKKSAVKEMNNILTLLEEKRDEANLIISGHSYMTVKEKRELINEVEKNTNIDEINKTIEEVKATDGVANWGLMQLTKKGLNDIEDFVEVTRQWYVKIKEKYFLVQYYSEGKQYYYGGEEVKFLICFLNYDYLTDETINRVFGKYSDDDLVRMDDTICSMVINFFNIRDNKKIDFTSITIDKKMGKQLTYISYLLTTKDCEKIDQEFIRYFSEDYGKNKICDLMMAYYCEAYSRNIKNDYDFFLNDVIKKYNINNSSDYQKIIKKFKDAAPIEEKTLIN